MPPRERKPKTTDEKVDALGVLHYKLADRVDAVEKTLAEVEKTAKAGVDIAKAAVARHLDHVRMHPSAPNARYRSKGAGPDDELPVDGPTDQGETAVDPDDEEEEPPLCLLANTDLDVTVEALKELADWLRKVYVRYGDVNLPDCWAYHPAVATRLWALYQVWKAVYEAEGASAFGVMDWEIRYRMPLVVALNAELEDCRLAKHQDPNAYVAPGLFGTEMLGDLAHWYTDGKYGSAAPPPPDKGMLADSEQRRKDRQRRAGE